ncbi:MAG: signal peptidase I [Deltaproteobacteria bacterium]|nr:signal peptidase I [Deltaproteobacteria bacterium]
MQNKLEGRSGRGPRKSLFREYGEALVIALVLALIIRAFLVQAFSIPSGSMQPTLLIGDYLLVNKFSYGIRNPFSNKVLIPINQPQRGDVVVFIFPQDPSKDYIKRVVGLPGDQVQVINKKVYVNSQLVETPYAVYADQTMIPAGQSTRDNFGPVVVPRYSYFVMGDNRDQSYDSRFWGFVPDDALRGKAIIIYFSWEGHPGSTFFPSLLAGFKGLISKYSWNSQSFQVRWSRIGKLIK